MSSGFLTRSDTNRDVQRQKMATGLKFLIKEEEVFTANHRVNSLYKISLFENP